MAIGYNAELSFAAYSTKWVKSKSKQSRMIKVKFICGWTRILQ